MPLLLWFLRKSKDSQEHKEMSLSTFQDLTEETKFVEELTEETKGDQTKAFLTSIIEPKQDDSEPTQPDLIPQSPPQPCIPFPMKTFGKQQRSFSSSLYSKYPWLHYQEEGDSVLCFYCLVAIKRRLPATGNWH